MLLSAEQRNEFDRAKNAKAIRVTLYEVGIFIGALYLANKVGEIWPQYGAAVVTGVLGMWIALIISRQKDWKSLSFLEERLNRDEDERDLEAF